MKDPEDNWIEAFDNDCDRDCDYSEEPSDPEDMIWELDND